jgi:ATP-dependent Clp protease adaptor protein ClpS
MSEAPRPPAPVQTPADETVLLTLPPYAVILHNDDHNSMDHVVQSLLACVPELEAEEAIQVMLTAHEEGKARVIRCPLERAELYRDRLEAQGLTATIEKA